ncbi:Signal transduction histidine kinase CheA [Desulfovibrio sp. DV]|uniref:chemotaxis protein CheA n=1 Tax=Desulfovibrio sp. DV TaxID=1844708 RepID=UPI00094B7A7F|nr:chemotaxis protein CheA [Desulfovibrio sp. DV]OLN28361.1 Signal transduction histidine kinase CheA [Desulfovibrio sp. DV]
MQLDQGAKAFQEEALELLADAENVLLALENCPQDSGLIDRLFRAMHTVKGSGAMFGFDELARFTHEVETLLDLARSGVVALSSDVLTLLLACRDHILKLLACTGTDAADCSASDVLMNRLRAVAGGNDTRVAAAACGPPAAADKVAATWWVRYRPLPGTYLTGTDPLGLLDELAGMGLTRVVLHADHLPGVAGLDPERVAVWWDVALIADVGEAALRDVFMFVEDDHDVLVTRLSEVALRAADLDEFAAILGPTGWDETPVVLAAMSGHVHAVLARRSPVEDAGTAAAGEHPAGVSSSSIRVESGRLDKLVDLVGELVIIQSRLQQRAAASDDIQDRTLAEELARVAARLRDETLQIRMVPIGSIFGTLRRLVRDLSGELGKQAVFETEGGDTELDKSVIDRLKDPLVHILRNCLDHGLEDPETRLAAGKPAAGAVRLRASHESGEVHIGITDDGGGVDMARVRQRALVRGLLAPDEEADEKRVLECLFEPGFSTASAVSNVSGRGVGMDVVKQVIEGLRGQVSLETTFGQGTRLTIRLPLTLAIIDGMQVRVGREFYILPLSSVVACQERTCQGPAVPVDSIPWRDRLTPCVSLRALLGVAGERPRYERIILARVDGEDVGLAVDVVVGQLQAVIKPLSDIYKGLDFISGTAVNGDGGISLILDVSRLVRFAMGTAAAQP